MLWVRIGLEGTTLQKRSLEMHVRIVTDPYKARRNNAAEPTVGNTRASRPYRARGNNAMPGLSAASLQTAIGNARTSHDGSV